MARRRTRQNVAIGRRLGASPEALEKMRQNDAQEVWSAQCRRCKMKLTGKLEWLKTHKCEAPHGT